MRLAILMAVLVAGCGGGSTSRFPDYADCPDGGVHDPQDPTYSCKYCEATRPESCCYFVPTATFSTCSCSNGSQVTIDAGSCDPVSEAEQVCEDHCSCTCDPSP